MGRPKSLVPKLCLHAGTGQWYYKRDGKFFYLGNDAAAAERAYRRDVARMLLEPGAAPDPGRPLSVAEAAAGYVRERQALVSGSQLEHYKTAGRVLAEVCGALPAAEFGAAQMRQVKDRLLALDVGWAEGACVRLVREALAGGERPSREVEALALAAGHARSVYHQARKRLGVLSRRDGARWLARLPEGAGAPRTRRLSRRYVNALLGVVRTMWRRLASDGLVPQERAAEVCGVLNAEPGQGRETAGRLPPPAADVDAVLARLSPPKFAAVLRLHRLTGARPGELCRLSRGQVSTGPGEFVPLTVKGRQLRVEAPAGRWLYVPAMHKTRRKGQPRVVVLGPVSQAILAPYLAEGFAATPTAYRQAVRRACGRAGVEPWTPYQIRHLFASDRAQVVDLDDLRAQLGHSDAATTSLYVADLIARASRLAE